jgi:hypothetical protein
MILYNISKSLWQPMVIFCAYRPTHFTVAITIVDDNGDFFNTGDG